MERTSVSEGQQTYDNINGLEVLTILKGRWSPYTRERKPERAVAGQNA